MYAVILHAHQKIDRIAHRYLRAMNGEFIPAGFPTIRRILHFEGRNGPDATKLKKNSQATQPWHFHDPFEDNDLHLFEQITSHYKELVNALTVHDEIRAGFEAAWLAHAIVDGLTPAHHYPYEKELELLRGEKRHSRRGLVGRAYVKGDTALLSIQRSLKLIGPKGLLTTHAMFEAGACSIILALRLKRALPENEDIQDFQRLGIIEYFKRQSREIGVLSLYERFYETGWTPRLSRDIQRELAPRMVRTVALAWQAAMLDAGLVSKRS